MLCAMVLVWIAAYSSPAFRPCVNGKRRLCVFPDVDWLRARLQRASVDCALLNKTCQQPRPFHLRGICKVAPGTFESGILTPWTAEESLQWQYYCQPADAYSLRVQSCWEIPGSADEQKIPLHFRKSARGGQGVALVTLQHSIFHPRAEDIDGVQVCKFGRPHTAAPFEAVARGAGWVL